MRDGEGVLQGNMGTLTLGSLVRLQEKGRPCHTLSCLHAPTSRNAGSFRQPGPTGRAHCVGVFDTAVSCRRKMRKCSEKITCTASESINCRSGVPVWQPRRHALNLGCGPSFNAVGALNKEPRHCFPGLPAPGACMYSF